MERLTQRAGIAPVLDATAPSSGDKAVKQMAEILPPAAFRGRIELCPDSRAKKLGKRNYGKNRNRLTCFFTGGRR
jgi:hypothetical protein